MISELKNNERVYGSLANTFVNKKEGLFCAPSAELQEPLKRVLGDSSDQIQKEQVFESIVQDMLEQASIDNSNSEKQASSLFQFYYFF